MFAKHGQNVLRDFSETMFHKFGVRLAILAGYRDAEGEPTIALYVFNQLHPHTFKRSTIAITMRIWVWIPSRNATNCGIKTRWSMISRNGLPSPSVSLVRLYFASRVVS